MPHCRTGKVWKGNGSQQDGPHRKETVEKQGATPVLSEMSPGFSDKPKEQAKGPSRFGMHLSSCEQAPSPVIHAAMMPGGCEAVSSPSWHLARSPTPPWRSHSPTAALLTCMVTVLVSTGTQRRPSSPQQPPQRCRETQEGLKMYSTSLGNSVMTSTSCSRGRQKLRFQISRKVRTAIDQGGGL